MKADMEIAMEIMHKVYAKMKPDHDCTLDHPTALERFEGGYGFCGSFTLVFQFFLHKKGVENRRIDILSIFEERNWNHTIAEARINGKWIAFDPTTNLCFGVPFLDLVDNPTIATEVTNAYIAKGGDGRWDRICGPQGYDPGRGFFQLTTELYYSNIVWWEVNRRAVTV